MLIIRKDLRMRIEKINTKSSTNFGITMELGPSLTSAKADNEIPDNVLKQITQYGHDLFELGGNHKVVLDVEFEDGLGQYFLKEASSEPYRIGHTPFSSYHKGISAVSRLDFLQKNIPLEWLKSLSSDLLHHFR